MAAPRKVVAPPPPVPKPRPQKKRAGYGFELYAPGTLKLSQVDLDVRTDRTRYDAELEALQERAYALQTQVFLARKRAVFVVEGWDAAGKGGAIKRFTAHMDPRGFKVWPIAAPKDAERRHHYLWRFWARMPEEGELCVFDRSWYGRVLVERVEGFARPREWRRAYDEMNAFEHMLTADGVGMTKVFLHIDKKTQLRRFKAREADETKRYKVGPEDWRNREKWEAYEEATQEMLDRTHRPDAPWVLVPGNDKKYARLEFLRVCIQRLEALLTEKD